MGQIYCHINWKCLISRKSLLLTGMLKYHTLSIIRWHCTVRFWPKYVCCHPLDVMLDIVYLTSSLIQFVFQCPSQPNALPCLPMVLAETTPCISSISVHRMSWLKKSLVISSYLCPHMVMAETSSFHFLKRKKTEQSQQAHSASNTMDIWICL